MKFSSIFLLAALLCAIAAGCTQQAREGNEVRMTSSGFSPQVLKIKAGETVTFINDDTEPHWPASGMHPTHNKYPEPGGCIGSTFDACGGLERGESFSFTFRYRGEWDYHDHLNSGMAGKIIVE